MKRTTTYTAEDIRHGDEYYDMPHDFELVPASDYDALAAELEAVKAERDALANSGALVPVRIDNPNRDVAYDWYMTPTGLGWWGENKHWMPCVETPESYHDAADCYPVRLVPIAEWKVER